MVCKLLENVLRHEQQERINDEDTCSYEETPKLYVQKISAGIVDTILAHPVVQVIIIIFIRT